MIQDDKIVNEISVLRFEIAFCFPLNRQDIGIVELQKRKKKMFAVLESMIL